MQSEHTTSEDVPAERIPPGIHLPEHKQLSLGDNVQIVRANLPKLLILPLSQHMGVPATPLVKPGDKVCKGQQIAEATSPISAAVHASSSGKILAIEDRPVPHPSGMDAPCIVIEPDGMERWVDPLPALDWRTLSAPEILKAIRNAGIAGLGGASFPTAVKLKPGGDRPVENLIINGVECEPYITADDVLMRNHTAELIAGIQIIEHLLSPQNILLAVEENKPEAIAKLQKALTGSNIRLIKTPRQYPSGGERQLVQMLVGREVPSGGLPADIGIVCQNVATVVSIYRALEQGIPLIHRITTVTGGAVSRPRNYETLLGTPVADLLHQSELQEEHLAALIMGGPMMGFSLPSQQVPTVKSTNCLLAAATAELCPPQAPQACIRCGLCDEVCPAYLLPQQLYWYARNEDDEQLQKHNLFDCIECGACAWICPSQLPLVQYYRAAKGRSRRQESENRRAEIARKRFESREERMESMRRQQEQQRRKRRQETRSQSDTDLIAETLARVQQKKQEPEKHE